jgi:hypothetical protein
MVLAERSVKTLRPPSICYKESGRVDLDEAL